MAALAVAAFLTAMAPATAGAISRKQATRIALKALKPERHRGRVVVFAERSPLPAGSRVFEIGTDRSTRLRYRVRTPALRRPAWLFWMDLAHDARFEHPSVMLLVDNRTGRIVRRERQQWFPLIGRRIRRSARGAGRRRTTRPSVRRPAFLATRRAYHSRRYQVFKHLRRPSRRRLAPPPFAFRAGAVGVAAGLPTRIQGPPPVVTAADMARDCMILIGNDVDPQFEGDFRGMEAVADRIGLRHQRANGSANLRRRVAQSVAAGCNDVFIYVSGHGVPPPGFKDPDTGQAMEGGPPGVSVRKTVDVQVDRRGNVTYLVEEDFLRLGDLERIVDENMATFKIKIDACFAGRFEALKNKPRVKILELASGADEYAASNIEELEANGEVVEDPTPNPFEAGEFTNQNIYGMEAWYTSQAEVERTGADLARGLRRAFDLGLPANTAAAVGLNTPQVYSIDSPPPPPPPVGLYVDGAWTFFGGDPTEVQYAGQAVNRAGSMYRQSSTPLDLVRVVVPGGRQIVNQLCPSQLPTTQVSTTSSANDTLTCSGGSLPLNTRFTLNVQTSPAPSAGMGGQIYGRQDGQLKGPFAISGP